MAASEKTPSEYPFSLICKARHGNVEVFATEDVTLDQAVAYADAMQAVAKEKGLGDVTVVYLDFDGDWVDVTYHHVSQPVPFERIRRITGYLVGTLDRFNDAKRAEVTDRVKHGTGGDMR